MNRYESDNRKRSLLSSEGADLAKIIATFGIVLGHSYNFFGYAHITNDYLFLLNGLQAFAFSGVTVFFFLSGYFFMLKDNWQWWNNLKKKARTLAIPYSLFILCYAVLNCLGYYVAPNLFDNFRAYSLKDWLDHLIGYPFFTPPLFYDPFWFLRDLILLNVFSFILVPAVKKVSGYILIPTMLVLWFLPVPMYFRQSFAFFITGMWYGLRKEISVIQKPYSFFLFVIGYLLPIVCKSDYAMRVSIIILSFSVISFAEILVTKKEEIRERTHVLIAYSFPIYSLHGLLLTFMQRIIAGHYNASFAGGVFVYITLPFVVILFCIVVASLWKSLFPNVYSVFMGGRH